MINRVPIISAGFRSSHKIMLTVSATNTRLNDVQSANTEGPAHLSLPNKLNRIKSIKNVPFQRSLQPIPEEVVKKHDWKGCVRLMKKTDEYSIRKELEEDSVIEIRANINNQTDTPCLREVIYPQLVHDLAEHWGYHDLASVFALLGCLEEACNRCDEDILDPRKIYFRRSQETEYLKVEPTTLGGKGNNYYIYNNPYANARISDLTGRNCGEVETSGDKNWGYKIAKELPYGGLNFLVSMHVGAIPESSYSSKTEITSGEQVYLYFLLADIIGQGILVHRDIRCPYPNAVIVELPGDRGLKVNIVNEAAKRVLDAKYAESPSLYRRTD